MNIDTVNMTVGSLRQHYLNNDFTPTQLVHALRERAKQFGDYNIWIYRLTAGEIQPYLDQLTDKTPEDLPLYGIPFAIKDNIDLAGIPTTAACTEFAFTPKKHAESVKRLIDLGAIPLGKTNLDQFATGLNGTRSPYGPCRNAYNPEYISGGSSSGSAVAVALGLAAFSLGTDTAGSGRVPASLNNLVGVKPTKGRVSTRGVVPACRSLDVVNVFCRVIEDVAPLFQAIAAYDEQDPYSRKPPNVSQSETPIDRPLKIGIPTDDQLEFFGDTQCETLFKRYVNELKSIVELVEVDYQPFKEAASLLYEGPWVAERQLSMSQALAHYPNSINPAVYRVVTSKESSAKDTFSSFYRLQELKRLADNEMDKVDCLLTPTNGAQYTIEQLQNDPIHLNNNLGYYTNYMNLLDYSALAIPAGFTARGLPFGITIVGSAFADSDLLFIAQKLINPSHKLR